MSKDKYFYNPEINYYFLSVSYVGQSPAWIRRPYQTKDEIDNFILNEYLINPDKYKNLEVLDESLLREKIHVKNSNDELVEIDMSSWIFGEHYSSQSDYMKKVFSGKEGFGYNQGYQEFIESEVT